MHTPEPWIADIWGKGSFDIKAQVPGKAWHVIICARNESNKPLESEANARLIAAAPEMYQLLKNIYDHGFHATNTEKKIDHVGYKEIENIFYKIEGK